MPAATTRRAPPSAGLAVSLLLLLSAAGTCRAQPTCDAATSRPCQDECLALDKPCSPKAVVCDGASQQACNGACIPDSQRCFPEGLCPAGRTFCALRWKCLPAGEDCVSLPDIDIDTPSICPDGQIFCIYKGMQCKPKADCDYNPFRDSAGGRTSPRGAAAAAGAALTCALVALAF